MEIKDNSMASRLFSAINYVLVGVFCLSVIIPFLFVLSASVSSETNIAKYGLMLWPKQLNFDAYKLILHSDMIKTSFLSSIFIAGVGTVLSMALTSMLAYPLSKTYLPYNRILSFFIYFTVLFNGGIIPLYLVVKGLGLTNSLWSVILTMAVSPWYMILLRNFFSEIPEEIEQSAMIDGANHATILFRIILPLSLPAIAAISLFYCVAFWNQWFLALMFLTEKSKWPLQVLLMQMLQAAMVDPEAQRSMDQVGYIPPAESLKMAVLVITTLPIMLVYPFLQKYFAKGLLIGAVKG